MKTHRHGPHGPVCGKADGVNAADMDPPEVTCKRCRKMQPRPHEGCHYEYPDRGQPGERFRVLIVQGPPDPSLPERWQGVDHSVSGGYYDPVRRRRLR